MSGTLPPPGSPISKRRAVIGAAVAGALALGAAIVPIAAGTAAASSVFTAGDIVVYRVGDGSTSLSDKAAPVFLDEYSPAGSLVRSVALPTGDNGAAHEVTASGSATSEGELTLSADGRYLLVPGYHQAVGTSSVSSTDDVTLARVGADGGVDTSTVLKGFADGNNVRGATSTDGTGIWVSGAAGIGYATLGASTYTQLTGDNVRQVQVVGGRLYTTSNKSNVGVSTVGTGTPTTSGQSVANLPGSPESSGDPYNAVLLNLSGGSAADTMYVSDNSAGKIEKFSLANGSWKAEGSKSLSNVVDLTGSVVGGKAVLYATGSGSSGTSGTLSTLTDSAGVGASLSGSVTTLATAPSKQAFRGIALAPTAGGGTGPTSPSTAPTSTPASTPPSTPASTPSGSKTPTLAASLATLLGAVGNTNNPAATLTIGDAYYGASAVTLTAKSSSTSVVPSSGLVFSGTGPTRTLAVTPAKAGYATLTVTATAPDGNTATGTIAYAASIADASDPAADYYSGIGNASVMIDAGGGYFLIGDDETNVLYLYQQGVTTPIKTFDFTAILPDGTDAVDIEAGARVGNRIYWSGSMSNSGSAGNLEPATDTLFATDIAGSGASTNLTYVGAYTNLRADMVAWDKANGNTLGLAASAAEGQGSKDPAGFNIEGMEFAPSSTSTAYFAFRAPQESPSNRTKALIVPATNVDQLVTGAASKATFGNAIQMDLGGLGIRDIRKNADNQYVIVSGTADGSNNAAALYSWDGVATDAPAKDALTMPTSAASGAWEIIGNVPDPLVSGSPLSMAQDDGDVVWYNDGKTSKDGLTAQYMKFLRDTLTWR
ncbi:hypothetical protein Caci_7459 [Catenulispora acidiphila DSM 44928]|uniref:Uncharacterized protein n=1 Tax=Catenulispora acidiphila (strain DSM 44928 / JCM 14897 / NBRC 102108 / NRRL B-24433 / ID139908) TaxID=479433 RepID=C7Q9W5_CATAD|nr:hypothetical protein [Catenulispora acidiphila]ACU76284.1 hypothetical protein Caci_7459 [Catenulispora acidiphila DSM 44928]